MIDKWHSCSFYNQQLEVYLNMWICKSLAAFIWEADSMKTASDCMLNIAGEKKIKIYSVSYWKCDTKVDFGVSETPYAAQAWYGLPKVCTVSRRLVAARSW